MNIRSRRDKIIQLLSEQGSVEVKDLASRLATSLVTVRSDLSSLEKEGKLQRFFGGAKLPDTTHTLKDKNQKFDFELDVSQRYKINDTAKTRIARKAAEMVPSNATVIIDSGSTTHLLARELAKKGNLTVITNNLAAASSLVCVNSITLALSGGIYRSVSQSIHGQKAEQFFDGIYADIAFIGADGLDPERGITTFNEGYNVTQVMAQCAKLIFILADSSKLSRSGFNEVLAPEQLQTIITDSEIPQSVIDRFEEKGISVIVV
ncbi:DeoR/GlpR transcriptional regulator [Vibrio sinensis]|uniref:DeoR/GlpR transcriptional regulator n=1 Tax=Vibrio sinensis TaxID=2302434 RepID=A0A3A6QXF0_9VIBR|nr:DeoR/GlpR family DNA-binding transcription regulator [Vibrio sinensis]RJX67149.1 DeoR/GlpR transcriptional regulator [Vibrio sinensis]